jgi:hypothetical protein
LKCEYQTRGHLDCSFLLVLFTVQCTFKKEINIKTKLKEETKTDGGSNRYIFKQ